MSHLMSPPGTRLIRHLILLWKAAINLNCCCIPLACIGIRCMILGTATQLWEFPRIDSWLSSSAFQCVTSFILDIPSMPIGFNGMHVDVYVSWIWSHKIACLSQSCQEYAYKICLLAGESDTFDMPPHGARMYDTGQPLDHEPNMGQVPVVPPGTPPGENWGPAPHFNGLQGGNGGGGNFMGPGRQSPSLPLSQQAMMGENMPPHPHLMMPMRGLHDQPMPPHSDVSDSDNNFSEYPPVTSHSHVEVYWQAAGPDKECVALTHYRKSNANWLCDAWQGVMNIHHGNSSSQGSPQWRRIICGGLSRFSSQDITMVETLCFSSTWMHGLICLV